MPARISPKIRLHDSYLLLRFRCCRKKQERFCDNVDYKETEKELFPSYDMFVGFQTFFKSWFIFQSPYVLTDSFRHFNN